MYDKGGKPYQIAGETPSLLRNRVGARRGRVQYTQPFDTALMWAQEHVESGNSNKHDNSTRGTVVPASIWK